MFVLFARLFDLLATAVDRRLQRRRLLALDDRMLHDIGVSRADVEAEWKKPAWRD